MPKSQMDELQGGIELSLAVLPETRDFYSHENVRSTIQRFGMTENVCSSLRLAICTVNFPRFSGHFLITLEVSTKAGEIQNSLLDNNFTNHSSWQ